MATRKDVDALRDPLSDLSILVRAELSKFVRALDLTAPGKARDALLEYVLLLVEEYGQVAASIAADWYEDLRAASGVAGAFTAQAAPSYPAEAVEKRVRSASGGLFDGDVEQTLAALSYSIDKYVKQPARDTVVNSGMVDPWAPRFARVPAGTTTCGFCILLASRGPVYLTRESAGEFAKFHGNCDCQIVMIGPSDALPEGYDPDSLYEEVKAAEARVGGDVTDIAAEVERNRREIRNMVPAALAEGSEVLPPDFWPMPEKVWRKIIRKHAADSRIFAGASRFEGWTDDEIVQGILDTIRTGVVDESRGVENLTYRKVVRGIETIVGTYVHDGKKRIITAYPPNPEHRRLQA